MQRHQFLKLVGPSILVWGVMAFYYIAWGL